MTKQCRNANGESELRVSLLVRFIRAWSVELASIFVIRASSLPPDLPVLHQLCRDFLQETGGALENIAKPAAQTHLGIGQIQLVSRPGDCDVKQSAFFFNGIASFQRTRAGKHPIRKPDEQNS